MYKMPCTTIQYLMYLDEFGKVAQNNQSRHGEDFDDWDIIVHDCNDDENDHSDNGDHDNLKDMLHDMEDIVDDEDYEIFQQLFVDSEKPLFIGSKQHGNDIDVCLAPLIDDLKELWHSGIQVYDAYINESFRLRAMVFCTINDFPAYRNLSGYSTKAAKACPICEDDTYSLRTYPSHDHKTLLVFNMIHSKVIDPEVLDFWQRDITLTICQLEMYFPLSFFDIMVHLVSNIVEEIKVEKRKMVGYAGMLDQPSSSEESSGFSLPSSFKKGEDSPCVDQLAQQPRRKRSITLLKKQTKNADLMHIQFNKDNRPTRDNYITFINWVGVMARSMISINELAWDKIEK
ncbi:hypothetical protein OSB04_029421 [Centaurea solstitialis]|uniref:DUF4218 domain-containing protein n=1 Tax=Centaurea solstitialis TaxID=347529 RepID=A0AA38W8N5_9ASTR|nr:hypothetical protein OSB04_029421 [Centaurea solstitialis]